MGLDLAQVANQLPQMASRLSDNNADRMSQLAKVLEYVQLHREEWRGVECRQRLHDYTALATDGSQIDVDRHAPVRCYLINVGWVVLRYGASPMAELDSTATIHLTGDDSSDDDETSEMVDQADLSLYRAAEEIQRLAELLEQRPSSGFRLALLDGPLVLRGAAARFLRGRGSREYLERVKSALERIAAQSSPDSPTAVAGYTSLTSSRDCVDTLQLPGSHLMTDSHLFMRLLEPGQRTIPFQSSSNVLSAQWGQEHPLWFFYLRTEDEVSKVEVPEWVARSEGLLDATHGALLEQCRLGQGYPVALSEAHERAVVTVADREAFWEMVYGLLAEQAMPAYSSAKSRSKRSRFV